MARILRVELVPSQFWGYRTHLTGSLEWKEIAWREKQRTGFRCEYCGQLAKPLFCHHEYEYVEKEGRIWRKFVGYAVTCGPCDEVHHLGRAELYVEGASDRAMARMMRLRGLSKAEVEAEVDNVWDEWERRSALQSVYDRTFVDRFYQPYGRTRGRAK